MSNIQPLKVSEKLYECDIYNGLNPFVNKQLSQNQHGLIKQRSLLFTNLVVFSHFVCWGLDAVTSVLSIQ